MNADAAGAALEDLAETAGERVRKRSVMIAGHATSLSLEDAFWRAARAEAARSGVSLNALIETIDAARGPQPAGNLSSAVRCYLLRTAPMRAAAGRDLEAET